MVIVKAILEFENSQDTQEVDIIINRPIEDIEALGEDEQNTTLADLISDETGYCVQEIIGYKEPYYIIN